MRDSCKRMTRGGRIRLIAWLICCGHSSPLFAQGGDLWYWWELSADGGQTWHGSSLEVAATTNSVSARIRETWTPPAGPVYQGCFFDGVVTAASGDAITDLSVMDLYWSGSLIPVATRIGPVIKVDDPGDSEPPGLGPTWYTAVNPNVSPSFLNPIRILQFTLHLDGTPGERTFSQVFRPDIGTPDGRISILREISPGVWRSNFPHMTVTDAVLRVVPPPGAISVAAVCAVLCYPRRRASR